LLPSYHLVQDGAGYVYSTSGEQLETHLKLLVSLASSLPDFLSAPCLTFDDGHVSQFRYAFPLLQKYGVRAIFFVIAGWMGGRPDYMTWAQLRELTAAGHEVQSHGLTHRFLTRCTDSELAQELQLARSELQQRLGAGVDAISIPFGRWNRRVLQACADAGYRRIYTSDPRPAARSGEQIQVFGRFMVRSSTTEDEFRRVILADRRTLLSLEVKHRCKFWMRTLLGDNLYHRLCGVLGSRHTLEEVRGEYESQAKLR